MLYVIRPKKVAAALFVLVLVLGVASTVAKLALQSVGPDRYRGLMEITRRFDLDHEINIPTWYSSTTLMACAVLLGVISVAKRRAGCRYAIHWGLLALAFLYLSMDEAANLHEILIVPLRRRFSAHGFLYFTWVIPGGACVAAFALAYVKFLLHLDRKTRRLFIYCAVLFVGGALGVELLGGACADWYGLESLWYLAAMTAEELLEMLGVALFIYALLRYVQQEVGSVQIRVIDDVPEDAALSATRP